MARKSTLVTPELIQSAKRELKKIGKIGIIANKLKAIILTEKQGISGTADILNISKSNLIKDIKTFKGCAEDLKSKRKNCQNLLLNQEQLQVVRLWIEENCNITTNELRIKIIEKFCINIGRTTVYRYMKKLGFVHKKPRPRHYKQDLLKVEEFKKDIKKKSKI